MIRSATIGAVIDITVVPGMNMLKKDCFLISTNALKGNLSIYNSIGDRTVVEIVP